MITTHHQQILFLCFLCFLCFHTLFSLAASSKISHVDMITDGKTLVSDKLNFEMGFFGPHNNKNDSSSSRYVGIWYYDIPQSPLVWVANRGNPVRGRGGAITITSDGNLVILDEKKNQVWSSNVSFSMNNSNSEAVLSDDGNLVLSNLHDVNGTKVVWQSFENPSDTYLPGMKVPVSGVKSKNNKNYAFTSWKSVNDPSLGNYTMGVDPDQLPQIVVWEGGKRRWRTGYFDGRIFTGVKMTGNYLYGFTLNVDSEGGKYFVYHPSNKDDKVRFQIGWDGFEREFMWNEVEKKWTQIQKGPFNECEVYNKCGNFAVCDLSVSPMCSCIKGFEPKDRDEWRNFNWSGGCKRVTPLKDEASNGSRSEVSVGDDGFLELRSMKMPDFAQVVTVNPIDKDDCESSCFKNSSCAAYANVIGIGCMVWYEELVDVQHFGSGGNSLYIRLANSELGDGGKKNKILIISAVVGGLIFLGIFAWLVWRFKGKLKFRPTVSSAPCCKDSDVDVPVYDASKNRDLSAEFSGSADLGLEGNELSGPELPLFNFSCISKATNDFSEENKLGQGGFGPVYKGKLPSGEQVAVKRLSKRSGQGLEEFKNEMMLIAKLQHRNLVRLMGCSIQGEEKLLVYEYMPNKSLDCFLFNPIKQTQLDWTRRLEIIEGIARGLLYLHRDSRLRIIHRDLKASNILLDENMNPKISDFGLARIFGCNQNEANTTRVVGTYGYMSPEYAMEGLFSVKSDVYSFGVLLLEIVNGRKNTSFRNSDDSSLIGYAWHLWNEHRAMEIVDPCIRDSCPKNKALRCIHIGMLCVQDSAAHRPNMSTVVLMLESEATNLPMPRQPLNTSMRMSEDRELHMDGLDVSNDLTVTMVVGR
ncbi:hypothetical protein RIF29_41494 [Crotalaria pallida]|uniref:Receptor-like serine/threonine-protein kinase n=1 Tax=Crotalaria pallida TaxID=3830 RepID=A0AAN9E5I7_CROPI